MKNLKLVCLLFGLTMFTTACLQEPLAKSAKIEQASAQQQQNNPPPANTQNPASLIQPLTAQEKIDYAVGYAELGGLIEKVDLSPDGSVAGQKMANCYMVTDTSVEQEPHNSPTETYWYEMRLVDKSPTEICPVAFSFKVTNTDDSITYISTSQYELNIEILDPVLKSLHDIHKETCTGSGSHSSADQNIDRSVNLNCTIESATLGSITRDLEFNFHMEHISSLDKPEASLIDYSVKITTTIKEEVFVDSIQIAIDAERNITKTESLSGLFSSWPSYDVHSFMKYLIEPSI